MGFFHDKSSSAPRAAVVVTDSRLKNSCVLVSDRAADSRPTGLMVAMVYNNSNNDNYTTIMYAVEQTLNAFINDKIIIKCNRDDENNEY